MCKTHHQSNDDAKKREYKIFANKLTKTKVLAKKRFYAEELENKVIHVRHGSCFAHYSQENLQKTANFRKI